MRGCGAEPVHHRDVPEQSWFIPGRLEPPGEPLARYRPAQPVRAVEGYVRSLTQPGDLVVDLFCQGPTVVREAATAGRRALGLSVNPLLLVAARLGLDQRDSAALNAAFTRLADSPKGDVPLQRHLASLYRSACPTCGAVGIAVWFAWDRDGSYPFMKAVRCSHCDGVEEGAPDDDDVELARRTSPRGLAYYYALDRVAPPGHPARERAAELVELYTPRNLSALMDITMRLEDLDVSEEVGTALTAVLLDCFDAGSSLDPYDEDRPRPRTLRVPTLYVERNVWLCFEEGFSSLLAADSPSHVRAAGDVPALLESEVEGYALVSHAARDVRKIIRPGSAALVVTDPPRPDAVFWALSALWAGWLWESRAARAVRPFLRRRRFDWEWHWRVLRAALSAAGPVLSPDGHLVTLFSEPDDALLESVCLAASGAGYVLEGWGYSPELGHRLVWRWEQAGPVPPVDVDDLERDLATAAGEVVAQTLQERGEPTTWTLLHSAAYAGLAEGGLLAQAATIPKEGPPALAFAAHAVRRAFESAPIGRFEGKKGGAERELWWLTDSSGTGEPLADRIEAQVWELLVQQSTWYLEDLVNAVYGRVHGRLTPDLALVLVCADSYSAQQGETLRLRSEDDPLRRAAELKTLRDDLVELGERLGFEAGMEDGWDVRWMEKGRESHVFAIASTAALAHHLLARRPTDEGAQRCLVLPGGRAQLVTFKLQRDARLARVVEADEWQFIKFRHLRRLVAKEELDRYVLKTVLGLDPIVEQEAAQIPLF